MTCSIKMYITHKVPAMILGYTKIFSKTVVILLQKYFVSQVALFGDDYILYEYYGNVTGRRVSLWSSCPSTTILLCPCTVSATRAGVLKHFLLKGNNLALMVGHGFKAPSTYYSVYYCWECRVALRPQVSLTGWLPVHYAQIIEVIKN